MKHIPLLLCIILPIFYNEVYSQGHLYNIEWSRCYGGSRNENQGGTSPFGNVILRTAEGGYIVAGITSSIDGDIDRRRRRDDPFIKDSCRNEDIWIIKFNAQNQIVWEQYYGGEATDHVNTIRQTTDGGYILCGVTSSITGDFPFDTTGISHIHNKGGTNDGYVMKLDSLGRKVWVSRIGGSATDWIGSVLQTSDGGYLAVGESYSTDEHWLGLSWIRNPGPWSDALVVKLGVDGEKLWSELFGGTQRDVVSNALETPTGGYILCSSTFSIDGDVSYPHFKDSINQIGATFDIWLLEISSTGKIIRDKCFGGSDLEASDDILQANDGGLVIVGYTVPEIPPAKIRTGDVIGYHPEKKGLIYGATDAWIFKIDSAWNILWQNCIGGSQQDRIKSLRVTNSGGFGFVGYSNSSDSDLIGINQPDNNWDIWIGEIASSGELQWQQCFGGTANDYGKGIVVTEGIENYILYGAVNSSDGDIVGNHGGIAPHFSDIWVAKLKPSSNIIEASSSGARFANPYPNPTSEEMNLYIHPSEPVESVEFFNPLGQEFYPSYEISGNHLTANTATLSNGIYIVRITYKNLNVQEVRKFVKSN